MRALGLAALLVAGLATPGFCAGYDQLNAGIALYNLRDWDGAIAQFNQALNSGDLLADQRYIAQLDRGRALAAKGELDAALRDYSACVEQRPDDSDPLFSRAELYLAAGQPEAAQKDAQTAIRAEFEFVESHSLRARAFELQGDAASALKDYQAIHDRTPANASIMFDIGITDYLSGQFDDATAAFRKDDPAHYAYDWLWLALTNVKRGVPISQPASRQFDSSRWPAVLMNFFQGEGSEETVHAAAAQGEARLQQGQTCEADFYLAEWRRLHGDNAGAKLLLQKAARDCPRGFPEWYAAEVDLKNDN